MSVEHVKALLDKPERPQADALVPIIHGKFTLTASGLLIDGDPTIEEWAEVGHVLAIMEHGIQFLVGDWIKFGEAHYHELAAQFIDARMWRPETVRVYKWLAQSVPMENRMLGPYGLTVGHHQAVAALAPAQQRKWLRRAMEEPEHHWSVARLKAAVKDSGEREQTSWFLIVRLESEPKRDELLKRLSLEGYDCRGGEKR